MPNLGDALNAVLFFESIVISGRILNTLSSFSTKNQNSMSKVISVLLCLLSIQVHAQHTGNVQFRKSQISTDQQLPEASFQTDRSILVDVKAIMNVEAASYVAVFNVSQTASTIGNRREYMHTTPKVIDSTSALRHNRLFASLRYCLTVVRSPIL